MIHAPACIVGYTGSPLEPYAVGVSTIVHRIDNSTGTTPLLLFVYALEITRCESIETTLRMRRLLWAGAFIGMSGGRWQKRIVFGSLEGAVRRGRGGKEKEWTDCVQSDIRAFVIAGDWKATVLEAKVWVEAVTEGGEGS